MPSFPSLDSFTSLRLRLLISIRRMPGPTFSTYRLAALCVFVFFTFVFIYSAATIHHGNNPVQQIKDTASGATNSATHIFKHEQATMSETFL